MNSSPITSWEGAEAYFTFADKPAVLVFFVLATAAVCIGGVISMIRHESYSYKKLNGK
ncbi:hypothetical protein [Dongia sp.]|uniref:hypothetical protein n=1 Tax=Dongia sp. TaxID=1977262 RepID=UPI0035AFB5A0